MKAKQKMWLNELGSLQNSSREKNSLAKKFMRVIHKLIERKVKRKTMFEEFFTTNKYVDEERIKKYENYRKLMFEENPA